MIELIEFEVRGLAPKDKVIVIGESSEPFGMIDILLKFKYYYILYCHL